jgi:hypothetical protein
VFVRDRAAQLTRRISVGPGGQQANDGSWRRGEWRLKIAACDSDSWVRLSYPC